MARDIEKKGFVQSLSNFMSDPEGLTQEDMVAELGEQGVDVEELKRKATEIVVRGSEEWRLDWRKRATQRMAEIAKLLDFRSTAITATAAMRNRATRFIEQTYGPRALKQAEAYFRNKDNLSEDDLKSLVEDLEQLELLEKSEHEED